ncbi:MoaE protein-domain-containing protein [Plectosphaerella cucumerina]|uniref:Molybdopterin synthase catalytic subunit n=1 Tax=Plectosphaerella cucumerina TaxID=40658 RepID=A0A8K0X332_9PEZI|nr:MoaE protein-domain-containing protein [Plectosphaerella cucumerina]
MASVEDPKPHPTQDDSSDRGPWTLTSPGCHVSLTYDTLSPSAALDLVRSPRAGALVLFAGTTRDNFDGRAVKELQYSAYVPRALRTMLSVAEGVMARHNGKGHDEEKDTTRAKCCAPAKAGTNPGVVGVAIIHRLGVVPVGEESILIAVASAHRAEGWRAGEEALEEVKDKVEVWKLEEFHGGEGVWRANRDGQAGVRVDGEGQQAP